MSVVAVIFLAALAALVVSVALEFLGRPGDGE